MDKIEIVKRGTVRRAKLYYLRNRVGKKALKVQNIKDVYMTDEKEEVVVPETGEKETETESEVVEKIIPEEEKQEEKKEE